MEAANAPASNYPGSVFESVDVDQWMRTFAFERIVGNWDSYGLGRGKTCMRTGGMVFLGSCSPGMWTSPSTVEETDRRTASGAQEDPAIQRMFDDFAIRRRLWQAYIDAEWPLLPDQVAALESVPGRMPFPQQWRPDHRQQCPDVPGSPALTIQNAIKANDVPGPEITSNGGRDVTTGASSVVLTGNAPLALAGFSGQQRSLSRPVDRLRPGE